jgi:hypothetical protein
MPRTIISKVKVLEVYPDAECWSHNNGFGRISYYIIKANKKTKYQSSQAKAWANAWQIIRAEQRKKQGNAPKEITTIRIKPTVKAAIIAKHNSVQKWVDSMTHDFLTK